MRGDRNETAGTSEHQQHGHGTHCTFSIFIMDLFRLVKLYLPYHFIHSFHPYHFRFSLNPNPNILQLILWVEGGKTIMSFLIYLTWVREAEVVPWRKKNYLI